MSETVRISGSPPERTSMNYAALREGGMALIRQWAEETWTDHNVHDPGITLLEAYSYAMTELGFRLRLDVADLIRSGEAHDEAGLEPAHRVLSSGPVTETDLRKLLLDHPLVSDAQVSLRAEGEVSFYRNIRPYPFSPFTYLPLRARVRPSGLYEVAVEFADGDLNRNTYPFPILVGEGTPDARTYGAEIAFPHWDEEEAVPFRENIAIDSIAMVAADGTPVWRELPEALTYFGEIRVDYTDPAGTARTAPPLWVVLRIAALENPAAVVPGILAAAQEGLESSAAGLPLALFAARVRSAYGAASQVQRYVRGWRNLGEEPVRLRVARVQEIAVRARLEVTGGIDVERLLAGIFMDIDRALTPRVRFQSLAEQRALAQDGDAAGIYDGPLLRHGFLDDSTLGAARPAMLYTSDLLRLIMRRRSRAGTDLVAQENPGGRDIVAVTDLALSNFVNNRPITTDASDCLNLVEIDRYLPRLSLPKSRIVPVRNDAEVAFDADRVESLLAELRADEAAGARTADTSPVWPVPRGDLLPVEDYFPFQNDLPMLYGVGEAALPDSAGPARRMAARQLQGYLLLFEQFLADLAAQLGNLNRFFSADPEQQATYFTKALFELPGMPKLLKRFPIGGPLQDWQDFVQDPANPFLAALEAAAESRECQLDRRNRMFDHLLARQGEETVAFGQELHRWAQQELMVASIPPARIPARMAKRREAANARLMRAKAALLRDAPELNAFRLLAWNTPLLRRPELLRIVRSGSKYRGTLTLDGRDRLRLVARVHRVTGEAVLDFDSPADLAIAGEEALVLAGRPGLYNVVDGGPGRRSYRLRDGTDGSARLVAVSPQTWTTLAAANSALRAAATGFAALRLESSLTAMERRIAHQTGIRSQIRRRLLVPIAEYFEIYDEADADGLIEKRWRFWERPGGAGQVLLSSVSHFEDATDDAAVQRAEASIREVLRYGLDEWNYLVSEAGPDTYNFELQDPVDPKDPEDPAKGKLGLRNLPWATRREAEQGIAETVDHLYRYYSTEGFHLLEHLLLRPRQAGDPFLALPVRDGDTIKWEDDPYSQRISLVFPSGYMRHFSTSGDTAEPERVPPHRFRDPEFRRHAERMVQQVCPAHLLPRVYWVDRQTPAALRPRDAVTNDPIPDSRASFDEFEQRYFNWLDTVLIPGAAVATLNSARNRLVQALNAIAQQRP